jgi:tagatose 1,6-diphosphate aldolase
MVIPHRSTMSPTSSTTPKAPPPDLLADDVVELRLLRVMGPGGTTERPENEKFLSGVAEFRFAIHRRADGMRVGRIHIRATSDEGIVRLIGHSGYAVDEAHRRNGYATRAVRLIVQLGGYWNILPLWIYVEPENVASRRTLERAGFVLIDVIDSAAELMTLGVGSKVFRYRSAG